MKQLLVLLVLSGAVWGQAAPSSFSAIGVPATPAPEPNPPAAVAAPANRASAMPDLLPQPKGKSTVIGGTIAKVDRVRDELTIKIFGDGKMRIGFDGRTRIDRNGAPASEADLQIGERVYLDTRQAGKNIFAEHIRMAAQDATGQTTGQVMSYDGRTGELVLNDAISPQTLKLRVVAATTISRDNQPASREDLTSGTLVSVAFLPSGTGQSVARQVSILATPGKTFLFVGRVAQLDLHLGLLVVVDPRDQKSYEIAFDPKVIAVSDNLREGSKVEATTSFDGRRYVATEIRVDSTPTP